MGGPPSSNGLTDLDKELRDRRPGNGGVRVQLLLGLDHLHKLHERQRLCRGNRRSGIVSSRDSA